MDNPNINKEVYDRYVDATVALFMEYYATMLSGSIHTEMSANGKTDIAFPAELDSRCRALIKKEIIHQRRKQYLRATMKTLRYVAIFAVTLLSLSSFLFMTVEAFRVPIINYYMEQKDGYWEIFGQTESNQEMDNGTIDVSDPLAGLIPEEYELVLLEGESIVPLTAIYEEANGKQLFFSTESVTSVIGIDSEGAQVSEKFQLCGCDAVLVVEDSDVNLVWVERDIGIVFTIHAQGMPADTIIGIAEEIITITLK